MLKLFERNIATVEQRLVLVAPPQATVPDLFTRVAVDSVRHKRLVREMQAVRGNVYLHGGYLTPEQLTAGGLHQNPRGRQELASPDDRCERPGHCTRVPRRSTTRTPVHWKPAGAELPTCASGGMEGQTLRCGQSEITQARRDGLRYAEVGGWAVSKERRCSSEGLMLALAVYGLCRALGGALGITTANVTHASSSILRRLGGSYLEAGGATLPAYFDPKYNTMIELLRFDSRRPSLKYGLLVDILRVELAKVPVIVRPQGMWQPRQAKVREVDCWSTRRR